MPHSPLTEFALLARVPDEALDLERLVVAVARMGRPDLDPGAVSAELDTLAERVAEEVSPASPPDKLAADLGRAIGGTLGFRGDPAAFSGPEGSWIDRVIERRTGLPILVAIVWMRLGARVGVPISGIGYPGHFLVRLELPGAPLYVDPFAGGALVDAGDLLARLPAGVSRALLDPAPTRAIVTRVLTNLKHLHVDRGEHDAALAVVDRLLLVAGESPAELRDRGLLLLRVSRTVEAIRDLERYLALAPAAADRSAVEAVLARVRRA